MRAAGRLRPLARHRPARACRAARQICSPRSDAQHLHHIQAALPPAYAASFEQFAPVWHAVLQAAEAGAAVSGEPSTILDLASAQGEPACSLAQRFPRAEVVATDNEAAMVAAARERGERLALGTRFSTQQVDMRQICALAGMPPSEVGLQADLVTASLALHMLPPAEIEACLSGLHALLKPGGRLIATVWEDEFALLPLGRRCLARILGKDVDELPPLEPHSPLGLAHGRADALLKRAGFELGPHHNTIFPFSLNLGMRNSETTWMVGLMPCLGALQNIAEASGEGGSGGVFEAAKQAFIHETKDALDASGDIIVGPMQVRVLAAVKPPAP